MESLEFQLAGFDVRVSPYFLATVGILGLFGLADNVPGWVIVLQGLLIFVSILVHELGHAVVIRYFGIPCGPIEIHGLGGHVTHRQTTAGRQLAISLAGPAAGLLLGFLVVAAGPLFQGAVLGVAWSILVFINIGWSVYNLMPMLPLDGGNALMSLLQLRMNRIRAAKIAGVVGAVTGLGIAVAAQSFGYPFAGLIGLFCAWRSYQVYLAVSR